MSVAVSRAELATGWKAQWTFWPALLGSALFASLATWYFGPTEFELTNVLRTLLIGGVLAMFLLHWMPEKSNTAMRGIPFLLSVVLLTVVWVSLGTVEAAGFLVLLTLPVFAASLVSNGWLEYCVTAFAVALTAMAAFLANPAFRWYVERLESYPDWLRTLSARSVDASLPRDPTVGIGQLSELAVLYVALFGVAVLGSTVARAIVRLERQLSRSMRDLQESERLASQLLDDAPMLEAIVAQPSGRIVSASRALRELMPASGAAETLLELMKPEYPEDLQRVLDAESGGSITAATCELAGVYRILDVEVRPVELDDEQAKAIRIRDTAAADLAVAAVTSLGVALAVIGPDRRISFASEPFVALFPLATSGASAERALNLSHGLPAGWWDIAPQCDATARFSVADRAYAATIHLSGMHGDRPTVHLLVQREDEI